MLLTKQLVYVAFRGRYSVVDTYTLPGPQPRRRFNTDERGSGAAGYVSAGCTLCFLRYRRQAFAMRTSPIP
ncbi:hypothetical protein GCM10009632_11780 [Mycolicibacterium alvei]|uniref:Uncharacterized protein n=1 Tax=Mycolicibacterium alvei TaxID=67081 RepID=A0A6N4UWZ0_9MYCO|nr:hypothetical protein MALV_30770 [Mycolicibacterium alvei]